ncbi:hypothetical protein BRADI_4g29205v3 [Brachypodium distachyon]|uniref:GRF-type domain-containing protein n=1 Tax=Brachypodium distachyon TaxID=15368 RepID=A0A0Q3LC38_BRADI|nr:hypothetical protein BRADI_4g29205v3 [Brachypodium distachyon]
MARTGRCSGSHPRPPNRRRPHPFLGSNDSHRQPPPPEPLDPVVLSTKSTDPAIPGPDLAAPALTVIATTTEREEERVTSPALPSQPAGTFPLVKCPCCHSRTVLHLVSGSSQNLVRVFYKCPNHRRGPKGCNFFHWEDGEDNYVECLASAGVNLGNVVVYGGDSGGLTEAKEEEEVGGQPAIESKNSASDVLLKELVQKMDEIIGLCRMMVVVLVVFVAMMMYDVVVK